MKISSILLTTILLLATNLAMALEEPEYEVISATDVYEIRRYEPFIVAEVDVGGDADSAGNRAFRILASYIFGDNREQAKMSMTAPVTSVDSESVGYTYAFVMESKYTLETLPAPNDPRIRITRTEPRTMAAHRYSGRWTERNYQRHVEKLRATLAAEGVETRGGPMLARYNSPFTPWFMRRNEILFEIVD
jgi:hypothetical protein